MYPLFLLDQVCVEVLHMVFILLQDSDSGNSLFVQSLRGDPFRVSFFFSFATDEVHINFYFLNNIL